MGGSPSKVPQKLVKTVSFTIPKNKYKKYKKAIVVIGKMGSGKSAFVKMLATPQEK